MTTLRDNAQKEGARVLEFLERHSQSVLRDHGFDGQGQAPEAVVAATETGPDRRLKAAVVPTEKLETMSAIVPPTLKRGRFRAPDKLIASLRGA